MRDDSIKSPRMYLGVDSKQVQTSDGDIFWCIGANSYLKEAVCIVNGQLKESGVQLKGRGRQPYSNLSYRPELDMTPFCNSDQTQLYQNFIGM